MGEENRRSKINVCVRFRTNYLLAPRISKRKWGFYYISKDVCKRARLVVRPPHESQRCNLSSIFDEDSSNVIYELCMSIYRENISRLFCFEILHNLNESWFLVIKIQKYNAICVLVLNTGCSRTQRHSWKGW